MASLLRLINKLYKRTARPSGFASVPREGASAVWPVPAPSPMQVSAVYRCVRLLSESVASLGIRVLSISPWGERQQIHGSLDYLLNVQPDTAMSAFDFWRQLVADVLCTGNAYVVPCSVFGKEGLEYTRLALCSRGSVSHDTVADVYTVSDLRNGISGTYAEHEVIHIKGMAGLDPKHGVSVLAHARMALEIAGAGDRETLSRFEKGGDVRGIVSNDRSLRGFNEYTDNELKRTAECLDDCFASGERIVHLPGQVDFRQLSMTSSDMQFLESRKFTVREICRFFGVHPSFVFDDTSNNYKSAEMANLAFLSNTLDPMLRQIENEFRRKLWPRSLCSRHALEFDRRRFHACDLETRVRTQSAMIGAGLRTINEARLEEGLAPVEGGDSVIISANLRPLEEINDNDNEYED